MNENSPKPSKIELILTTQAGCMVCKSLVCTCEPTPEAKDDMKTKGLFQKYKVSRVDGKPISDGCIVMEWKDRNARQAIHAFARAMEESGYKQLAMDLDSRLADYGFKKDERSELKLLHQDYDKKNLEWLEERQKVAKLEEENKVLRDAWYSDECECSISHPESGEVDHYPCKRCVTLEKADAIRSGK